MLYQLTLLTCLFGTIFGASSDYGWVHRTLTGEPADLTEYNFLVGLNTGTTIDTSICGGTILSVRTVLLAASCFDGYDMTEQFYIHTIHDPMTVIPLAKIKIHEDYDSKTMANDVAIVQTAANIPFDDYTGNIHHAKSDFDPTLESTATIFQISFPTTSDGMILAYPATVNIVPLEKCKESLMVSEGQLCVTLPDAECPGYAHGYAMIQMEDGANVVTGVGSFTNSDCSVPTVYTNMATYSDWVDEHITAWKSGKA